MPQVLELSDGVMTPCNFSVRQYAIDGTGTISVDFYGSMNGAALKEKVLTLTSSSGLTSYELSNLHPWVQAVVTSGSPKIYVMGTL